ncbi:hypothetical protein SeMB42_g00994 [Synchytrium endobioticum]|uniref:GDP/GTP exchange factor Sec2 N-terminal domain-containing protein n=1 Tax=Synchytrium endobioticum TaxID=286115 RepID=A0A507CNF2_9FUNG|nr:hypothetical protein SeLEV6574_g06499 [Synchytrium endobioticum]TPX53102.1 hypothetical protein SeMB42_g00994 [Synchytrium endobioticum]
MDDPIESDLSLSSTCTSPIRRPSYIRTHAIKPPLPTSPPSAMVRRQSSSLSAPSRPPSYRNQIENRHSTSSLGAHVDDTSALKPPTMPTRKSTGGRTDTAKSTRELKQWSSQGTLIADTSSAVPSRPTSIVSDTTTHPVEPSPAARSVPPPEPATAPTPPPPACQPRRSWTRFLRTLLVGTGRCEACTRARTESRRLRNELHHLRNTATHLRACLAGHAALHRRNAVLSEELKEREQMWTVMLQERLKLIEERDDVIAELESLTQSLFEEANKMVADERRRSRDLQLSNDDLSSRVEELVKKMSARFANSRGGSRMASVASLSRVPSNVSVDRKRVEGCADT